MFLDKVITFTLGTVFLLVLACQGPSEEQKTALQSRRNTGLLHQPAFWDYAASSNMLQVEIAKVVAEKGSTQQARSMALEAVAFHGNALKELQQLVRHHQKIQLPDSLGGADLGLVLEFKLLEGEELDTHYQEFVLSTHHAQLSRYEEALLKAEEPKTRDWLMNMRAHLQEETSNVGSLATTEDVVEEVL
ncbi:DUF4142 domain-containing protein [Pontibacter mangrovi]|uniref:DUF4142 domain-containing protein n=1 Tax=Pontibacter mangrovi TaxID=2589816 RepID=A0A501WB35_9BACT|nr:DUF4142 domain-containing protein [Pontibacter mangrovi]TPE45264.1 DUF4142 domain-containing protein [Pontibacter mangrovi]